MDPWFTKEVVVITEHGPLEYASWVAQVLVTLIAIAAAVVAWFQLGEMGDYRKQRLRIANATLLLELDHRFDSKELVEARELFVQTAEEISAAVSGKHPLANEEEKLVKMIADWTERLDALRKDGKDKYSQLLRIGGFFETVGMMVKREYVSAQDALGLFRGPILMFGRYFKPHIDSRQNEAGVPKGLFEHALYLYDLAVAEAKRTPPSP
jgi:hypothetical protein